MARTILRMNVTPDQALDLTFAYQRLDTDAYAGRRVQDHPEVQAMCSEFVWTSPPLDHVEAMALLSDYDLLRTQKGDRT